ncbi:TIGR02556 family CRISPR-associated protein [Candidatus Bathyarchaeota archaeon]|nr:TIGR02556 family CRISPR-associated protein [Candidatus Bathyarchaeota archaeon]
MLSAVKSLGDYVCRKENLSVESMLIESSKIEDVKNVLCINFEQTKDGVVYRNVSISGYNLDDAERYLYRIHRHQRYDVTPTSRMNTPEKIRQRFTLWFQQCHEEYLKDPILLSLKDEFVGRIDQIFKDLNQEYLTIGEDEKRNTIVTLTVEDGSKKFIGDFEIFKRILREEAGRGFYSKHNVEAKGKGVCSICKKETEVLGFGSPFSFYTFDKKGFAPNLLQEDAWKCSPLCMDCSVALSAGKNFLSKYFYKGFYGFNFFLIPSFVFEFNDEIIETIASPKKRYKQILCREDDVLEAIAESNDQINLNFVFVKPKLSDYIDIMRYVEGVPPSWIKQISDATDEIFTKSVFRENSLKQIFGKKWVGNFNKKEGVDVTIGGLVRSFFPRSKIEGIQDKYFLDVVGDILAQRRIRSRFLIDAFMKTIESSFRKNTGSDDWKMKVAVLQSFALILLLHKLMIADESEEELPKKEAEKKDERFTNYFKEYSEAFNTPEKKAVFLEGLLAKNLLDVQYANRKSTPFREKLYGLKLDEGRVRKLFPDIIEKLREYKVAYTTLEQETAKAFVEAEQMGWKLSNDEISYFFSLGMVIAPVFKIKSVEDDVE